MPQVIYDLEHEPSIETRKWHNFTDANRPNYDRAMQQRMMAGKFITEFIQRLVAEWRRGR